MTEGASISTGFIDSGRFRRRDFSHPDYASRKAQAIRLRTARDINSPGYNPWQRARQQSRFVGRKSAELALAGSVVATKVSQPLPQPSPAFLPSTSPTPARFSVSRIVNNLKPKNKLQIVSSVLALLIIAGGIYLSVISWQNNQIVKIQATKLTAEANKAASSGSNTTNAISTVKPSASTYSSYAVAPGLPKYLKIPSIGVDAIVGQVGLLANGALGTPSNVYYTDWYTGSAEPGQPGATLIDGHVSSWTSKGVFYNLHLLKAGDAIQIVKGDNSVVNYQVVQTQTYSANSVNMQAAITPIVPGVSGLNLITCTGKVIKGTSEFNQRVIVFAKEV